MKKFWLLATCLFVFALTAQTRADEEIPDVFLDDGGFEDLAEPEPTAAAPAEGGETSVAAPTETSAPTDEPGGEATAPSDTNVVETPAIEQPVKDVAPKPAKKPAKAKSMAEKKSNKSKAAKNKLAKNRSKKSRGVASKEGFRLLKADCEMHESPSSDSPVLLTVKGSRKLWVENQGDGWLKGFRKSGHGYMSEDCFR